MSPRKPTSRKAAQQQLPLEMGPELGDLSGSVERIIYHNAANGFSVIRLRTAQPGKTSIVTCVGHLAQPREGARLHVFGQWVNDSRYGRQLRFDKVEELLPDTEEDIRNFLGSGQIKGLQMEMAARIVAAFGRDTFRVLDETPERLSEVKGIGEKTLDTIVRSWREKRCMRSLMLFLQPHGVSLALAVRIYKEYQEKALDVLQANPYQLATDVYGIGFVTADSIAAKLGFPPDSPMRSAAAALYILKESSQDGNVYLPMTPLLEMAGSKLRIPEELLRDALSGLEGQGRVVLETMDGEEGVFLTGNHVCEAGISHYLGRLLRTPKRTVVGMTDAEVRTAASDGEIDLADEQMFAIVKAVRSKVMVLTGGPGTGKTTILKKILRLYADEEATIQLAAPTGRAAKRMAEATGFKAQTIHRLLQYNPMEEEFQCNESKPLDCDLLVVDEASMMDTVLFYHLLKAVPLGATLLLVGDVCQLPSVGPGTVLSDIITSRTVPVVELGKIFRQSEESAIVRIAQMINEGRVPVVGEDPDGKLEFSFIVESDPEMAAQRIVELVSRTLPRRFPDLSPVDDIQVLTPMHKGPAGSVRLNAMLQQALNPGGQEYRRGDHVFRLDDKVMQIRNDYKKDVFNGDIGRITHIDRENRRMAVMFDEEKRYEFDELDSLVPAYAITVHKSQGSEYPVVVLPLMKGHYILLQRNLLYTAVTRGVRCVVVVGETSALAIAVNNNRIERRYTRLAQRLARDIG